MSTLDLIPLLWGAATTKTVTACQVASSADVEPMGHEGKPTPEKRRAHRPACQYCPELSFSRLATPALTNAARDDVI
jgi:hypothetical protein